MDEDLDSLLANVEYIQGNIVELQNELIAVDDSKVNPSFHLSSPLSHTHSYMYLPSSLPPFPSFQNDSDTMEAHAIITQCGPRDAKYLLEHLLTMTLALVRDHMC